jgi:crotonobetainyl-CoA:carnitine CoA-transferase CaiB-like acyl-CoA transferase
MPLPLHGLRVLDLSRLLPGAFATLMLAELGAEVIKIEDPIGGDPMRALPPLVNGRGIYDLLLGRGKKSVVLDLRRAESAAVLDQLVATADIVVESFRPRTAKKLGVSGQQLRARYPRLIHCAITGYGQTGPYAEHPGHDLNYVAVSGMLAADGRRPGELPKMFIADVGGGAMTSVIGILAAVIGRERHGEGASLDVSMHDAALYWVMLPGARDVVEGGAAAVDDLPTYGAHACYNIYETRDGQRIALGALEKKFWVAFCNGIGRPDLSARHLTDAEDQVALLRDVRALFATRNARRMDGPLCGARCLPDARQYPGRGPARPPCGRQRDRPCRYRACAASARLLFRNPPSSPRPLRSANTPRPSWPP